MVVDSDTHPNAALCTAPFYLTVDTTVSVETYGGRGALTNIDGQTAFIPGAAGSSGFLGIAIRDTAANLYLLSKCREENGDGSSSVETLSFSSSELAPFAGKLVTLDFVDTYSGAWGWTSFDKVTISGSGVLATTAITTTTVPAVQLADGVYLGSLAIESLFVTSLGGSWKYVSNSYATGMLVDSDSEDEFGLGANGSVHRNAIRRSAPFAVADTTEISVDTYGGQGSTASIAGDPATVSGDSGSGGFIGVCIRAVATNAWVACKRRSSNGEGVSSLETLSFTSADLGLDAGSLITVDIVDTFSGTWGWFSFDNVVISVPRPSRPHLRPPSQP
jgi:hypothetical protein